MTRLVWLLALVLAVQTGLAAVLVDVARVLAAVAGFSPEASGVVLVVALAAYAAYRADWPDGYGGMLAGAWR